MIIGVKNFAACYNHLSMINKPPRQKSFKFSTEAVSKVRQPLLFLRLKILKLMDFHRKFIDG